MVQALKRSMHGEYATRDVRNVLAKLIAYLPKDVYLAQASSLIEIVRSDPGKMPNSKLTEDAPEFVIRLGDTGQLSHNIFLDMIRLDVNRPPYWAILGLCRAGSDVAEKAAPDLIRLLNSTDRVDNSELHSAVYVTLLRLGLKDAAFNDASAGQQYYQSWYADKLANVTTASPRSVCVSTTSMRPLPD